MLTEEEKIIFDKCIPYLPTSPVIFDVGAYKGAYTDYVLSKVPDADCWLFEPNADLHAQLSKYKAFDIMLLDREGVQPFFRCLNKADELSSTYRREVFGQIEYEEQQKPCTSIDAFCLEHLLPSIDFLKIDVEGAEMDVLNGCMNMLQDKNIHFIQVEYGGTYPDAGISFLDIIQLIGQFGYRAYELVGDKLNLLTEENFVEDYRFANFLITHHDIG